MEGRKRIGADHRLAGEPFAETRTPPLDDHLPAPLPLCMGSGTNRWRFSFSRKAVAVSGAGT
jgi:hypothetical protein